MEKLLTVLQDYQEVIVLAGMILLLVAMIAMLMIIHMQRRTNRMICAIQKKVQAYLDVVMEEAQEETADADPVCRQERQMRESIEKKKRQQEEAVFNAVLEEIFP